MEKSPEAFRTISEVADLLETPAHVLRFWESRFPQIRPVKRAGGRRYYRPGDVALLAGIKKLLHDDGLTIRGVQKILREQGIRHVAGLVAPLPDPIPGMTEITARDVAEEAEESFLLSALVHPSAPTETAQIIPLDQAFARQEAQRSQTVTAEITDREDTGDDAATTEEEVPEAPFIEAEEEAGSVETLPLFERPAPVMDPQPSPFAEDLGGDSTPAQPLSETEAEEGSPAPEAAAVASEGSTASPEPPSVAALLRRCRRARVAPHRAELEVLRDRLADLRDRVSEASRRRIR